MANQKKFSEIVAVLERIAPASLTAATYNSTTWVEIDDFQKFAGVYMGGAVAAGGTMDFSLVQATDTAGTGSKAISNCTATQLGASDDDEDIIINCTAADLDLANGFRFVGLEITTATAATIAGAYLLGVYPYNGPASDNDNASVTQIVN
jgi:hypothetical protein